LDDESHLFDPITNSQSNGTEEEKENEGIAALEERLFKP